jgi:hypothetical protein
MSITEIRWQALHNGVAVKSKSHKGQRHKGCGLCDWDKRAGNSKSRRPMRDWRQLARARDDLDSARSN